MSRILFPSFSLVLDSDDGSTIMCDYDRAERREPHVPMFAPLTSETLMRTIHLRAAPAFITYKCDYYPDEQDSASLFDDAPKKKFEFLRRYLKMIVEKLKGLRKL